MESPVIDIDFLANETLALSRALRSSGEFTQQDFFDNFEDFKTSSLELDSLDIFTDSEEVLLENSDTPDSGFPQTSGVVFKVDMSSSTFCVRGIVASDINHTIEKVIAGDDSLKRRLKISHKEDLQQIHYYQTSSVDQAEVIYENIINKRLPLHEEMVCNLSDPGFSWWYESLDCGFKVYFKSQSVERDKDFVRLGPIGDRAVAHRMLNKCEPFFRKFFSIKEFSSTEKSFEIRPVSKTDLNYQVLRSIFEKGEFNFTLDRAKFSLQEQKLLHFLDEIAALRGFWISVEEILSKN